MNNTYKAIFYRNKNFAAPTTFLKTTTLFRDRSVPTIKLLYHGLIALCLVRMASSTLKDISHLVKFDGNNFHELKFGCRLLLETNGLLDVIDGVEKIPSEVIVERAVTNQKVIDEWKSKDLNAINYLFSFIERKQQSTLFGCKTSHDIPHSTLTSFKGYLFILTALL
ncbi:Uncharacterized protein APZ42_002688 [Daphnia magna]|uniref:Uncharacterized protein n=1 Tax=Daphnia magna TaxID=35525 RepID=A0A164I3V7_9CRUS|nr:Uncharacterized protein APZ42_002688 [Daphnia magna]